MQQQPAKGRKAPGGGGPAAGGKRGKALAAAPPAAPLPVTARDGSMVRIYVETSLGTKLLVAVQPNLKVEAVKGARAAAAAGPTHTSVACSNIDDISPLLQALQLVQQPVAHPP